MKVDILYFEAGSGHRSAAKALQAALAGARPGWRVRALDVEQVIAGNRRWHALVSKGTRDFNDQLREERVVDLRGRVNLGLLSHDLLTERGIREVARFWEGDPPDGVVSVTPMYHPALYRAARLCNPEAVCITVPVDCEEFKPRYWFAPKVAQHYLNGTDRLWAQAKRAGVDPGFNHRVAGMMVDPGFYAPPPADREAELAKLGLDPKLPTALISFGGQGSVLLAQIARAMAERGSRMNALFLCGHNAAAKAEIDALAAPFPKAALGYLEQTPVHYHQLADVIVGKPGTMTINEALVLGKPMVIVRARGMKPVQEGNEAWAERRGFALLVDEPGEVPAALARATGEPAFREAAARHFHRGVFEVAERAAALVEARAHGPVTRRVEPRDEARHPPGDDPLWNESSYLTCYDPGSGLAAFSRVGLTPNTASADGVGGLLLPGGALALMQTAQHPEPRQGFRAGALEHTCLEPLRRWRVRYDGPVVRLLRPEEAPELTVAPLPGSGRVVLDLEVEGLHPPVEYKLAREGAESLADLLGSGSPAELRLAARRARTWGARLGRAVRMEGARRYEQAVRVTGTVVVDGREHRVDATGQRDHAWGLRDWTVFRRWRWLVGRLGEDLTFSLSRVDLVGLRHGGGYVHQGGTSREVLRWSMSGPMPEHPGQSVEVEAELEGGARLCFSAEVAGLLPVRFTDGTDHLVDTQRWVRLRSGALSGAGLAESLEHTP